MLVTNKGSESTDNYLKFIEVCSLAGVSSVELREKNLSFEEQLEFGQALKAILEPLGILLIVNDSVELALKIDADGVHLGESDGDLLEARQILGPEKIIGASVGSYIRLLVLNSMPIDYVGMGAVFPTNSKANINTTLGIEGLKNLALHSEHPIFAIDGINEINAKDVLRSGVQGLAVIGAIHKSLETAETVRKFRDLIERK